MTDRIEKAAQRRNFDEIILGKLNKLWQAWQKKPQVEVIEEDFSADEIPQFVIKDNVSAGDWDMDALENYDKDDLEEWGVQTWGSIDDYMDYSDTDTPVPDERQRVIITYPRDRVNELNHMLGIEISRPNYRLEEIMQS